MTQTRTTFIGISQVAVVTSDLDRAMRTWSRKYGVAPWRVYEWGELEVGELTLGGRPDRYAMRTALAELGDMGLELLQPLDDRSIYARSLERHGGRDHLHHLLLATDDYGEAKQAFQQEGVTSAQGGVIAGVRFDYLDTVPDLGFWIEIVHVPDGRELPPPTAIFPPNG